MPVLVTGVAGFIGSHLGERLVDSGESVVRIDSFTTYYGPTIKRRNVERLMSSDSFRLVVGSLREVDLNDLVAGMDVVYHLAAQPGEGVRRDNCVNADKSSHTGNGGIDSSNVFSEAGNLIAKPGFVDPAAGDFHLESGDACLAKYTPAPAPPVAR